MRILQITPELIRAVHIDQAAPVPLLQGQDAQSLSAQTKVQAAKAFVQLILRAVAALTNA